MGTTTFSGQLRQYGGSPVNPVTSGTAYFLKPSSGSDGNSGKSPEKAWKTWAYAVTAVAADKNDILYIVSEDNTASGTTDYQSSTLTISVDGLKIVGINAGGLYGQRSRIAQLSTATGVTNLVTWSASNSYMEGVHIFHGVNDATGTTPTAIEVSGDRNHFYRCHFAGIGHTAMDIAGAASLEVSGSENFFEQCVIGLDTIGRGSAANSEIAFSGGATRNYFKDCIIPTYADANTHQFILQAASGIDRFNIFDNCLFYNAVNSGAQTMTEAFDIAAGGSPAGGIILKNGCLIVGATEWDAGDEGNLWIEAPTGAVATQGIAVEPAT